MIRISMLEHLSPRTMALISGGPQQSDGAQRSCKEQSWMLKCAGSGQNSLYAANPIRRLLRAACPLLPVFQSFDQTHMGMVIEEGLTGDHILQTLIQGQCLLVLLCDIQRNFWISVLACLLLRRLRQARADPLAAPVGEYCQCIDIPFVLLRLAFQLPPNGCVESLFFSTSKAQNQPDHLGTLLSDLNELIAK